MPTQKQKTEAIDALAIYVEAKQEADAAGLAAELAKADAIKKMTAAGATSLSIELDDERVKGTIVRGERVVIDELKLRKSIGSAQWKKVTKEVLDKKKLEAETAIGNIDANKIAMASEVYENAPFIKITFGAKPEVPVAASKPTKLNEGVIRRKTRNTPVRPSKK